jgi:hypothetical protein
LQLRCVVLHERTHPSTFPISPENLSHAGVFTMDVGRATTLGTYAHSVSQSEDNVGMRRDVLTHTV